MTVKAKQKEGMEKPTFSIVSKYVRFFFAAFLAYRLSVPQTSFDSRGDSFYLFDYVTLING